MQRFLRWSFKEKWNFPTLRPTHISDNCSCVFMSACSFFRRKVWRIHYVREVFWTSRWNFSHIFRAALRARFWIGGDPKDTCFCSQQTSFLLIKHSQGSFSLHQAREVKPKDALILNALKVTCDGAESSAWQNLMQDSGIKQTQKGCRFSVTGPGASRTWSGDGVPAVGDLNFEQENTQTAVPQNRNHKVWPSCATPLVTCTKASHLKQKVTAWNHKQTENGCTCRTLWQVFWEQNTCKAWLHQRRTICVIIKQVSCRKAGQNRTQEFSQENLLFTELDANFLVFLVFFSFSVLLRTLRNVLSPFRCVACTPVFTDYLCLETKLNTAQQVTKYSLGALTSMLAPEPDARSVWNLVLHKHEEQNIPLLDNVHTQLYVQLAKSTQGAQT